MEKEILLATSSPQIQETRTITGDELIQAQNYSRKFWTNPENAPDEETIKTIMACVV